MNKRTVTIGPVFLVHPTSMEQVLQEQRVSYPHLPDPTQIEVDINVLNDEGGVPVVVEQNKQHNKKTHRIFLYTPSYVLALCEEEAQNGYRIEHIEPANIQIYDQLAQGALSLNATRWHLCLHEREIPNNQSSYWTALEQEWQLLQEQLQQIRLQATQPAPVLPASITLPPHYERYLDIAEALITVTRQLEHTAHNVHPSQKQDETHASAQQAAIALLKEGKAANPSLLSVLVDHSYQPYELALVPPKLGTLSREATEVVQRALAVPDLLLIHDTPTAEQLPITLKLLQAYSITQQRVLVVARSQHTLQRLLAQLPDELLVIHLQPDDRSASDVSSRSLKTLAHQIQQQLLARTENALPPLTRLAVSKKTLDQWVERLQRHIATLNSAGTLQHLQALRQRLAEVEQVISAPFQPMLVEAAAELQQLEETLTSQKQKLENITERQAANEELRQKPAIGRLFTSVEHLAQSWVKRQQALVDSLQAQFDTKKQAYQQARETMQQVINGDPEYAWYLQRLQEIENQRATILAEAKKATAILQEALQELIPAQPPLEPLDEMSLQYYLNWFTITKTLFEQQHALLQEWRSQLSQHEELLSANLLRYADVVCGTCADIAACRELDQVEFDLVIVEDAAQIVLPDLLIPLVKARRAILFGDPQRLPPFPERAAHFWRETLASEEQRNDGRAGQISTQLTHSVFEQLWSSPVDARHALHLKTLQQIPPIIADFVSNHFYDEDLTISAAKESTQNPMQKRALSVHPLVLVDTSSMPAEQQHSSLPGKPKEKAQAAGIVGAGVNPAPTIPADAEEWGKSGYVNHGEAKLLADLVTAYQHAEHDWLLLVPYSAQAAFLHNLLQERLTIDEHELKERIGTVEALQDRTADVVFYGFTRSVSDGDPGILHDLRLLNVALTRAHQQVILVGDLSTLKHVNDAPFRTLLDELSKYVEQYGELLAYDECQSRVQTGILAVKR